MKFMKGAWKVLVGIKDGLVLIFMLIFFISLLAVLSGRPNAASVRDGALLVDLDGTIVEEPEEVDPLSLIAATRAPVKQYRARDVVRGIELAATDSRIKVVVLDLDSFLGGGQVHLARIGEAIDKVKKADKKVLAYATAYTNDSYQLAAHADEVWLDPMGGAVFAAPGGSRLYYGDFLDRFDINAHIYRVGTYKSAVEPYERADQSEPAKEAARALYEALWQKFVADVVKARPAARRLGDYAQNPAAAVLAAEGDLARLAIDYGLVDKLGGRAAFGNRVAEIAGDDDDKKPGDYAHTRLAALLAASPPDQSGEGIAVITVAGDIVDGDAGPGTAGGDRIVDLLDKGLADDNTKALVVRVDSPGGSALASERIRRAIQSWREAGKPVVVSMANVAASGGYWVSTASDEIFAEPETITGSIGIFAILPSFEGALSKYGINADGVAITPLSGQPDIFGGFNDSIDTLIQSGIEHNYRNFLQIVADSRGKTPAQVDEIAQGRVWDGGTARQLKLVDRFGSLEDALAAAAKRAKIDGDFHPVYLETPPSGWSEFFKSFTQPQPDERIARDPVGRLAQMRKATLLTLFDDLNRLSTSEGAQARCLECGGFGGVTALAPRGEAASGWLAMFDRLR